MARRGFIYRIPITRRNIGIHPHVVVLVAGRQCYVVPGFTPGGHKVTEAIAARIAIGTPPDKVFVSLDNAMHVTPHSAFTWHDCYWMISDGYLASKDHFKFLNPEGTMDASGIEAIVRGLLLLAEEKPEMFSPREITSLKKCLIVLDSDDIPDKSDPSA